MHFDYIVTFLGGGVAGTVLGHFLAMGRDKRNHKHDEQIARAARKNTLLAFLSVWASDLKANRRVVSANNVFQSMADRFDEQRRQLITLATPVEADLSSNQRIEFVSLVESVKEMTPGGTEGNAGREKLIEALSRLAKFLKERRSH